AAPGRAHAIEQRGQVVGQETQDQLALLSRWAREELQEHERPERSVRVAAEHDLVDRLGADLRLHALHGVAPVDVAVDGGLLLEVVDDQLGEGEGGRAHRGTIPPSAKTTWPVMKEPASLVSSSAGPIISSGCAMRGISCMRIMTSCAAGGLFRTMS